MRHSLFLFLNLKKSLHFEQEVLVFNTTTTHSSYDFQVISPTIRLRSHLLPVKPDLIHKLSSDKKLEASGSRPECIRYKIGSVVRRSDCRRNRQFLNISRM